MKLSTRLMIAMVSLVLVTAAAISLLTYHNLVVLALPRALERIDNHARAVATELESSVRGARADVIGFRTSEAAIGLMTAGLNRADDPTAGADGAEWRKRLANRFVAELTGKPTYAQLRVIGVADGGRELIRVDRSGPNGTTRIVPDAELRREGDQDYFKEAITLPAGQVHVSPVALNRERGVIETPHVPTLLTAAPLYTPDGKPLGIVVINIDLRPAFTLVRSSARNGTRVFVVNEHGDYLINLDPNREFGFEFGNPVRLQDDFPEFADLLAKQDTAPRVLADRSGARFGLGWESVRLAGGRKISVIQATPYAQVMASATAVLNSSLAAGTAAVLCALLLAGTLAHSLTKSLVQMTKAVEGFSRDEMIDVPVGGGREIGVLARAFTQMAADSRAKSAALSQESEERRRIFDTSPDLIMVTDQQGVLTRVNPASQAILGYSPEEMIGHGADEFILPEDLAPTRVEVRATRRGEAMRNFGASYVHKNGHVVALTWSGAWSEPARQYYFVGRDMTEQKESEQMARAIIDTALDAFVQMDEATTIIGWSPKAEAMLGWSAQEAVGQKLCELIIPTGNRAATSERIAQFLRDADNGILGRRYEAPTLRRDGREIDTEISLTALRRREGYVINGFIRDITDNKAAEEKLRQAQKMESVGQLTGGIAHDFNNMLTVITNTIDILGEAVADKPELAAITRLISKAADRGAELTGHLLAFARKQPLQPRETDVNALMGESEKLLRLTLGAHIEIETIAKGGVWQALVDPGQLSSALLNLALNARDAMPAGGKLTLETNNVVFDEAYARTNADVQPGSYVMVAVSDTGTGIPEAIRAKVFEPFFTTKEFGMGTGLGLSMVYGFVKQSGGHIKVYSEEGHGTTFKIYLPRACAQSDQIKEASIESAVVGGTETILIVEDDELVRTSVTAQIHNLGYTTLSAANAAEAIAIADGGATFDLLFTDMIMPGTMNGRQLADEMAKRRSSLKVLFTSGYTENAVIHHGRLDAGVLLLAKPYRKLDLARMLRRALVPAETLPSRIHELPKSKAV